ncbi:MAG: hypothetical protein ABI237_16045 [Ginsengibacter sp.]
MKIKITLITFLIILLINIISCKKNNDNSKTKTELLTSKTWVYDEYFEGYNSSNTILYYKRGKSSNLINFGIDRVTFKSDGTYSEINETGETLNGTWALLNGESQLQVINTTGTYISTIVVLNNDNYYWYDPSRANGIFAKMVH